MCNIVCVSVCVFVCLMNGDLKYYDNIYIYIPRRKKFIFNIYNKILHSVMKY